MKELHQCQAKILKKFIFSETLSYTEMKPSKLMENNKFQFHLDQLKKTGLIEKVDDKYKLTRAGKMYVSRMDSQKALTKPQSKLGAAVCCTRTRNNEREFLIFTRLKQPYFSCQGFMAGKVEYGEAVLDTAKRELREEANLEGEPVLIGINHYFTFLDGMVVDDLMQFMTWVNEPKGQLKGCKEGKYEWVPENKLEEYVIKPFQSKEQFWREIDMIRNFDGNPKMYEMAWEDVEGKRF